MTRESARIGRLGRISRIGRINLLGAAALIVLALLAASALPSARGASVVTVTTTDYTEMCDASAAVALTPNVFIVSNDEDNTLRGYTVGGGTPQIRVDLQTFLGAEAEADIEGAARVGDRIYWITSHGRNKTGKKRPDRLNFFATRISAAGGSATATAAATVTPEGTPYKELLRDLIQPVLDARGFSAASGQAPESKDGLNVEGLADSGSGLFIGFRNPLPKGKALVVELTNPDKLIVEPKERAKAGRIFELDLGGRGIRSLDALPASAGGGFAIVAGSFDDTRDFAFYRWSGKDEAPVRIDVPPFTNFNPEAMFVDATSSPAKLMLLSDDGDVPIGSLPCKDPGTPPNKKRFKLATLTLN